jgi:hypothetical protein
MSIFTSQNEKKKKYKIINLYIAVYRDNIDIST